MSYKMFALLFGLLLVAAPFTSTMAKANDEGDEYVDEEDDAPAGADVDEKDVVVLSDGNFTETLKGSKFALVEFYAPWCGHCQKLKPEYAAAATTLKSTVPDVIIAKVDATEAKTLAEKYEIQGYPTIKWFVDGELASDFQGGRERDEIVKWITKKTGPAATVLAATADLKDLEGKDQLVVVGYFKKFEGEEYNTFLKAAQASEDGTFGTTSSPEVAAAAGLTSAPGVAAITNFADEERELVPFTEKITTEAVKKFVTGEKIPPTIAFNEDNSQKIFGSGIARQLLLLAYAKDLKKGTKAFDAYRTASKSFKGRFVFVTVDLDSESKEPVVNFFGVKEEDAPVILGFEMEKNRKYRLTGDITAESVTKFAAGIEDGSVLADFKSAPIPDEPLDGDVAIVVGKTFDQIVKDPTKDVLLEVYAPWCGHCKKLEPTYKKLAKRFKKIDSVVIAKMDGTENEHPDIEVKGFPTIVFFPAGKEKLGLEFSESDRSVKGFTKFLKKNAKIAFELPKKNGSDGSDAKDEL